MTWPPWPNGKGRVHEVISGNESNLAVLYVWLFLSIDDKGTLQEKQVAAQCLLDAHFTKQQGFAMQALAHGWELESKNTNSHNNVKKAFKTVYWYFQDLFDKSLVQEWNQVNGDIHVPDKKRGFSFESLEACMHACMVTQTKGAKGWR